MRSLQIKKATVMLVHTTEPVQQVGLETGIPVGRSATGVCVSIRRKKSCRAVAPEDHQIGENQVVKSDQTDKRTDMASGDDGALFSIEWKEALWARFFTGAPQRQRRSVEQYKIVKRA